MIKMSFILFLVAGLHPISSYAELPLGKKPPVLVLSDTCGGRLNGNPWSSSEISDKVFLLYYVDPDESDLNENYFEALKAEKFPKNTVSSVAIINLKASWMPQFILKTILKKKQKKYTTTVYVYDKCKKGVTLWNLADNSSDILIFSRDGKVLFSKDGKLADDEIKKAISIIWNELDDINNKADE